IKRRVVAQALEQTSQGIVLLPYRIAREQITILRVKNKDQPHQGCQQPAVQVIRISPCEIDNTVFTDSIISRDEAAQQLMKRDEDLFSQLGRDRFLILAAFGQQ